MTNTLPVRSYIVKRERYEALIAVAEAAERAIAANPYGLQTLAEALARLDEADQEAT